MSVLDWIVVGAVWSIPFLLIVAKRYLERNR